MGIIKLAILSLIIIFLLITTISLFIPSEIRVSKAINIAADDRVVNSYIGNLAEWKRWHPAFKEVPDAEFMVSGDTLITVKGTTINLLGRKEEEIVTEIRKGSGRSIISGIKILRHQEGDSATLQWYMDFRLPWYPWEKFKSLFYENFYGIQMEQGLFNLKELSEGRRS